MYYSFQTILNIVFKRQPLVDNSQIANLMLPFAYSDQNGNILRENISFQLINIFPVILYKEDHPEIITEASTKRGTAYTEISSITRATGINYKRL